ncbi:hypothetical protein [Allosediminivita pacifica]|uniref:Glutathione S-transferase-like protein n=1 Tax=Allosediminivita pacifica TaxID=1267769 RepID=A0A2T6A3L1_9RHOB|nr:hypothetical protein [Allosediminivita pacifica]PTX38393.1 glutathione S-transferase-like protein [Allosediminivita pacifica]GGB29055.1 hypothetical protein GCM10011324_43360 [Allosediminivita pacifica]
MKLFHAPGSCSLGIRMILEEAGLPYELHRLDVRAGDQRRPEYLAVRRCQLNSLAPRKWPVLERQMLAAPFQASKASIR